jgi:hypothetical protein
VNRAAPRKALLLNLTDDKLDLWEKMPKAALAPEIDTHEKFDKAVQLAWERGVRSLEATTTGLQPQDLKILHEVTFWGMLQKSWLTFRDRMPADAANDDQSPKFSRMEQDLHTAANKCGNFLITEAETGVRASTPKERLSKLATYHSALMQILPFRDNIDCPVINRILAGIVLESQLRHCFGSEKLNLKADADDYQAALKAAHAHEAFKPLEQIVKTLAGPAYTISRFQSLGDSDNHPKLRH